MAMASETHVPNIHHASFGMDGLRVGHGDDPDGVIDRMMSSLREHDEVWDLTRQMIGSKVSTKH